MVLEYYEILNLLVNSQLQYVQAGLSVDHFIKRQGSTYFIAFRTGDVADDLVK